jgi:hypothetical protein
MSTRPTGPTEGFTDPARTEPFQGQPYTGQPQFQQGHPLQNRGGDGISAGDLAKVARNELLTRETKPGFLTSEFLSSIIVAICVLVAALIVDGGDAFSAKEAWTLVTALSIGYMISRGLAKSGVRHASKNDDRGL